MNSGPKSATSTKKPMISRPTVTLPLTVARRHRLRSRASGGCSMFVSTGIAVTLKLSPPLAAHARIKNDVDHIGQQVGDENGHRDNQEEALNHGVVFVV